MRSADAEDYRLVADKIVDLFNPKDQDIAEVAILLDALDRAREYIVSQPCVCAPGAEEGLVEPCPRCAALGRTMDREEGTDQRVSNVDRLGAS